MKKILLIFIIILVGTFALFLFLDRNGEYAAEKAIWKTNQEFVKMGKDPGSAPAATFNHIAREYMKFTKRFPDSKLAPVAHILAGRVYMAKKDYPKAREILEDVIKIYSDNLDIQMDALVDITRTYALEFDDVNVLKSYQRAIDNYPLTAPGIKTPLLVAKFFADRKESRKAQKAFDDAIVHYKELIKDHPGTPSEYEALKYLAGCYLARQQWKNAFESFGKILMDYAATPLMDKETASSVIQSLNTVATVQMKDYDAPRELYEGFIEKYPTHPLNGVLKGMIESFKLLKEKNAQIMIKGPVRP